MTPAEWTKGHWPEIVSKLIGPEFADGKHHPCPCGDGKDRFRFSNLNDRGGYFCQCSDGSGDGFDLIQCVHNTDFAGAARLIEGVIGPREGEPHKPKASYAEVLRNTAVQSDRSRYLESRGLIVPPGLQWHTGVEYRTDCEVIATYPAMLAPVTRDGKFLTYHVTYLHEGGKAPVDPCRKILPGPSTKGGAVELWPAAKTMGIAEGIETAIAASMIFRVPVWAALNTSLLKAWKPPEIARKVLIFADHDQNYAGHAAAYTLAHKLHGKVEVNVKMPPEPGDWNDELLEAAA